MSIHENKVFKNASWIIACKIIQSVVGLIINMISARYLGPSNYGLISYVSSVVAFAVPIAQLGLRNILVEEIVSNSEREGKTLGTSLGMSLLASIFGIIGVMTFTIIANPGETETILVCLLYSFSLIFQMTETIQYWYQAKLMSKYTSVVSLFAYIITAAYQIYILVSEKSIYWFAVTTSFDYLIISVLLTALYFKKGTQKLTFSFQLAKKLFSRSKYYIVSNMMVVIFAQTDKVMIKSMIGDEANGFYTAAFACAGLSSFIFAAIIDSYRPVIFVSKAVSQSRYEHSITKLYSIIIYLGLLQSIVFTFGAGIIISVLYGEKFIPAIPILRIITWYAAFSYMGSVRNIWVLSEEKHKYLWIVNLSGAILNVIGNYFLIKQCGAAGAAIASVVTQFFTNIVLCFIMKPFRPTVPLILKSLNPMIIFRHSDQ